MLQKILAGSFYLLFVVTPLIFTSFNHELFEYNKMMFVYAMTVIISGVWALKMLRERRLILNWTPLSWPILAFLGANFLSTIFSLDPHTSIWGYYTRSNGGLLSMIAYTILFGALVSNFDRAAVVRFLKAAILGGVLVALYGIPEHFGISPSCWILYREATASCWVQDVQARVFATLGQPNWFAAYLAMLIFPSLAFYLQSERIKTKLLFGLATVIMYMAMTFAYSRGATLGLVAGLATMLGLAGWQAVKKYSGSLRIHLKEVVVILAFFGVINLFFGSALTRFQLISIAPSAPAQAGSAGVTQLENGGTESGQIRLIVWRGALEIFKHYPLFGSGLETFAHAYYQYRPAEHNLVSEWDFLYNKAHNEFLNYLATTGLVGFGTYLWLIGAFGWWSYKHWRKQENFKTQLIVLAMFGAVVSYLVQNIFGFSVVVIAMLFYLFMAMGLVEADDRRALDAEDLKIKSFGQWLAGLVDRRKMAGKTGYIVAVTVVGLSMMYGLFTISRLWTADTIFARGSNYSDAGNPGQAYNYLTEAVFLNPDEPLYRSELGYAAASSALSLVDIDATLSAQLKAQAELETDQVLRDHPNNVSFLRTAIRTYYELAGLDQKFNQTTLDTFDKAIQHAPTDPKLYFNKAIVLDQLNEDDRAIEMLKKAIELKRNYREAYLILAEIYHRKGDNKAALEQLEIVLKLVPNDPEALAAIEKIKEK